MATLKEIAEIAGVHITTVSKALNNANDVSINTKNKIIRIAQDVGYSPKHLQKKEGESFTIAAIYPDFQSSYFSRLLMSIEASIASKGGFLVTACSQFNPEVELNLLRQFTQMQGIDGIILISPDNEFENRLKDYELHIPVVVLANEEVSKKYDFINIDDMGGIEYLKRMGHKQIGYLGETLTFQRLKYFRQAMEKHGLPVDESFIRVSPYRFEEAGYTAMNDMIESGSLRTAIYAAYDNIAIGALRALYGAGLKVPDDISIVGQDDILVSSYLKDRLTTINCHIEEQGSIVASILHTKILNPNFKAIQNVVISTELMLRDSTGVNKR